MICSNDYILSIETNINDPLTNLQNTRQNTWCNIAVERNDIFTSPSLSTPEEEQIEPAAIETTRDIINKLKDYRLSNITIMINEKPTISPNDPLNAKYIGYGVVRLFREFPKPLKQNSTQAEQQKTDKDYKIDEHEKEVYLNDETTVSIVAIPSYFTARDILGFIGAEHLNLLTHIRLIKSSDTNRMLGLLKFRTRESARAFHEEFNGKEFNIMENEVCHVVFIKSVIFKPLNQTSSSSAIPYLLEDPFTSLVKKSNLKNDHLGISEPIVKELPTCPVCLERMDSDITGLLTISCQHTFHCSCLTKWKDDTCPVCRYSSFRSGTADLGKKGNNIECSQCANTVNLWVCLICGNVGCGRYDSKHAITHYEETNHCFAMDIETQRVWDYAGDNYVHRLLQNETDGKLVELTESNNNDSHSLHSVVSHKSAKSADLQREEYVEILLSQLESQREYYESRLSEVAGLGSEKTAESKAILSSVKSNETSDKEEQPKVDLKNHSISDDRMINYQKEIKKLKPLVKKLERSFEEEKILSENLSKKLEEVNLENNKLKEEKEELSSQVNDLMFYLESQEKFKDASEDLKNGTVVIQESPEARRNARQQKKKGKKR